MCHSRIVDVGVRLDPARPGCVCTALPVASAAWTMRRWLWPPSRVRCSSSVAAVAGEGHALLDQPLDRPAAALDHEAHRVVVAQARPGDVGVADVVLEGVGAVQHGGDAALGPAEAPVQELVLGDEGRPSRVRRRRRAAESPASPLPMTGRRSRSME